MTLDHHAATALTEVVRRAAESDPEISERWQLIQDQFLENQRMVAESLAANGALQSDLATAEAVEIIWTLNHPSVYYLVVLERGWSEGRYESWLADAFIARLLGSGRTKRRRPLHDPHGGVLVSCLFSFAAWGRVGDAWSWRRTR